MRYWGSAEECSCRGRCSWRRAGAAPTPAVRRAAPADSQCFAATRHFIEGRFLAHWVAHGGLAANGDPLSGEFQQRLEDGNT